MVSKFPGADCDSCPLLEGTPIPGKGSKTPKVVIVGESPGKTEVQEHEPFIGISGILIKRTLADHNIDLEDVYFTNACMCQNNQGSLKANAKAAKCCRGRLVKEIEEHKPEVVLALGNIAAKSLLNEKVGITELRQGGARKSPYVDAPIICSFHPAACLRAVDNFPDLYQDVSKINNLKVYTNFEDTKNLIVTLDNADTILRQLESVNVLAADIETSGLIAKRDNVVCISISHRAGASVVLSEEVYHSSHRNKLKKILEDKSKTIIWQNGKFDTQFLWEDGINARVDEDTMLMHYTVDERPGKHDLGYLATEYAGAPAYKDVMRPYKTTGYHTAPRDLLYKYAGQDTDLTYRVYLELQKKMSDDNKWLYRNILLPGSDCLAKIEYEGVNVDMDKVNKLQQNFQHPIDMTETMLGFDYGLVNPRSPKQVKAAISAITNRSPVSTDKAFLRSLLGAGKEEYTIEQLEKWEPQKDEQCIARYMLIHRHYSTLIRTYINGIKRRVHNNRVYTSFLLHSTETGRLSSRNPNLQNIPRGSGIREIFAAEPGNTIISLDYSQVELRVLACLSGDENLKNVFREGRSLHKEVAIKMFGPNYSDDEYVKSKSLNFGIAYGIEAFKLSMDFNITLAEAQKIIDNWFRMFPRVKTYLENVKQRALQDGELVSPYKRHRKFWLITKETKKHILNQAINFNMQSTGSDLNLLAAIELQKVLPDVKIRILVHDALVIEAPTNSVLEVSKIAQKVMQDTGEAKFQFPFAVEVSTGPNWGELSYG